MSAPQPVALDRVPGNDDGRRDASRRAALLFLTILVTSLGGLAMVFLYPGDDMGFPHDAIVTNRQAFWLVLIGGAVNLAVGIPALALAGMRLARHRGAGLATIGGALMWLGAGMYAAGLANWAGLFTAATEPGVLDQATSIALVDALHGDGVRMWAAAMSGALMVALGTVVLSIGLLRARTLPRWIPIAAAVSIVATFVLPTQGVVGLVAEGPVAISSIAIGWHAWQHARHAPLAPTAQR